MNERVNNWVSDRVKDVVNVGVKDRVIKRSMDKPKGGACEGVGAAHTLFRVAK